MEHKSLWISVLRILSRPLTRSGRASFPSLSDGERYGIFGPVGYFLSVYFGSHFIRYFASRRGNFFGRVFEHVPRVTGSRHFSYRVDRYSHGGRAFFHGEYARFDVVRSFEMGSATRDYYYYVFVNGYPRSVFDGYDPSHFAVYFVTLMTVIRSFDRSRFRTLVVNVGRVGEQYDGMFLKIVRGKGPVVSVTVMNEGPFRLFPYDRYDPVRYRGDRA